MTTTRQPDDPVKDPAQQIEKEKLLNKPKPYKTVTPNP